MEKKKPYSSKRWMDNPGFKAVENKSVIFTKEQTKESDKRLERLMRSSGVLKQDEHIIDGKVVRTDENGVVQNENTD